MRPDIVKKIDRDYKGTLKAFFKALRLPFILASVLPFIAGSTLISQHFYLTGFLLGLFAVAATHLGANLINDYADSKSGLDWTDQKSYGFFGGSKMIQQNIFREAFYLEASSWFFVTAFIAVVFLSILLEDIAIIGFYLPVMILGIFYSQRPLQLSYNKLGEPVIFLLFGPVLVMGAHYIQGGELRDPASILLSLPFGLLTMSILIANEIPDYQDDRKYGKETWISFLGPRRSYLLYILFPVLALLSVGLSIFLEYLSEISFLAFLGLLPAGGAAFLLRRDFSDKDKLVLASKLAILSHALISLVITLDCVCLRFL